MNCPDCHGTGYAKKEWPPFSLWDILCKECGGAGIIHCCDGLHEQPEAEDDSDKTSNASAVKGTLTAISGSQEHDKTSNAVPK